MLRPHNHVYDFGPFVLDARSRILLRDAVTGGQPFAQHTRVEEALGDDSSQPSYSETIPKRGYRFLAPLKVSALDAAQVAPVVVGGETAVIEKPTLARVVSEEFEGLELPVEVKPLYVMNLR